MARPIGDRVKQVLEATERLGPATYRQISEATGLNVENTHKYCRRALAYGFMTKTDIHPKEYMAVEGWREMVVKPRFHPSPKVKTVQQEPTRMINSVFALGTA